MFQSSRLLVKDRRTWGGDAARLVHRLSVRALHATVTSLGFPNATYRVWGPVATAAAGRLFLAVAAVVLWWGGIGWGQAESAIVINELHTNPDVKTELVEFIELYNAGTTDVDLSGWQFTEGVLYTFPAGTKLHAGGYLIVAQNPAAIQAKWNVGRAGVPENLIFGPYAGGLSNEGERIVLRDAAGRLCDEVEYQLGFPWPTVGDPISDTQPGTGYSLQLVNPALDNNLGGSWRSALPTPAAANKGVLADNIPPQIRQVQRTPKQPKSGDVVTITAKVTDPDGVANVALFYQVVEPGAYFSRVDPEYGNGWTAVPMHDDGRAGDARAGDDIFTAQIPAGVQTHRRLIRYKIMVADSLGYAITVPYADDPQPNFAYFVYDGVPGWRGAVQPGVTPVIEYPAEVMQSLPVYHLLSKKSDVENCTWLSKYAGSEYLWYGTIVYDGDVYDHIRYRARGGVWRYSMGKNMWKFDFLRGHDFQARDDYGNPYSTTWKKLNFSACIQQGSFGQRGEQGMFEALSFRLFNLAGCPASKTNWVHFRIIDETYEDGTRNAAHPPLTTSGTQYDGDFWGLYMTIEQMDGRFLDDHDLPDGNLYKMEGSGALNNQGPTQPSNGSDLNQFLAYSSAESWWRQNVNLAAYYGYYATYQAVHDGDITSKNWFLYHDPDTNQWWQLPWDKDLTWTTYYGSNDPSDPFSRAGLLNISNISIENKNRLREVTDLLFNTDQTNQLIDEYAAIINDPAGGLSMVDADRCMWDYHWVMRTGAYPKYLDQAASFKAGQNMYYQSAASKGYPRTFEGMVQVMKDYVKTRGTYLDTKSADAAIPNTPTITATGPAGFPINALTFRTSTFSDPQGAGTFGALQWRIAEVSPGSKALGQPTVPSPIRRKAAGKYEIEAAWQSDEIKTYSSDMKIPAAAATPGHTYRVRCRMKDNTGRWSHWSSPVQFVAGEPLAAGLLANLRITEVMYNPAAPLSGGDNNDFEFIELKNIGDQTLDLSGVSIQQGVTFSFAGSSVTTLGPHKLVLVVRNKQAFLSRYGTALAGLIAGEYQGKLSNSGETVSLVDQWNGTVVEFTYGDGRGWPKAADGGGHSLVPLDAALLTEPQGSLNYAGNWRASTYIHGSPGADDPAPPATILLNEFVANPAAGQGSDWIELYNPTEASVNLTGWYLSDDVHDPGRWAIPAATIPPHGYMTFDAATSFGAGDGFGLSQDGEDVVLSYLPGAAAGRIVDCLSFKAQEQGVSLGRYPDGGPYWFRLEPTHNAANKNPILDVVIDEIMYHPLDPNEEYIELYNPTAKPVDLHSATAARRLSSGVDCNFPAGVSIPAGGRLVVVGFDPVVETSRRSAFLAAYHAGFLIPGVTIVGPWSGSLSNSSARVALEKSQPGENPASPIAWVIVDEVIYSNLAPWPTSADGHGSVLQRSHPEAGYSGNDPTNWPAAAPTPGK